ncbi:hypothetical protein LSAT2_010718 [Lamellibrachia satsuma]|nr:hypothetical protein LSAT2_010718 [Lamellibrachia satsuma]
MSFYVMPEGQPLAIVEQKQGLCLSSKTLVGDLVLDTLAYDPIKGSPTKELFWYNTVSSDNVGQQLQWLPS